MQSKNQGKSLNYNHNITNCPQMIAKFAKINLALGDQESDTDDSCDPRIYLINKTQPTPNPAQYVKSTKHEVLDLKEKLNKIKQKK